MTTTVTSFWQRLEAAIAPWNLLQHPFYRAWTRGDLTRSDLGAYAAEYWHHVSSFPTYLSALHARLPDAEMRREVLRNLSDEEGTDTAQGRPHSDLWMDFAQGMGVAAADVRTHETQPETKALIATFRELMQQVPAAAMAALYAYESKVPAIAAEKAAGLETLYGADAKTTRYFTLHRTADVHHANVWRGLIETQLAQAPEQESAALAAAERAARALWCALDGMERQRLN